MEFEQARQRLLGLKELIKALLYEALVPVDSAYELLFDAWEDVKEIEWTSCETTDRLLLESIDRQCREFAEMMGRPYRGLRRESRRSARR
jgi:hypothetical protein